MPREGRPWWWPKCGSCGRWLSWERMGEHDLDTPWRCGRCALRAEITALAALAPTPPHYLPEETP